MGTFGTEKSRDFRRDLDLEFSSQIWDLLYLDQMPWNEKQTYRLNIGPDMFPNSLTLVMTLTFDFQVQVFR